MDIRVFIKRIAVVVPVIVAVIIVIFLVRSRKGPEKLPISEEARHVRVIKVTPVDIIPRAVGYGHVEPGRTWQAVAEVSGKIVDVSLLLEKGEIVKAGTVLMKIDPTPYQLAIAQSESNIESIKAQLEELDTVERNQKSLLEIEEKTLGLSRKELERKEQLLKRKIISESDYEKEQAAYYLQLTKVQNLRNALNLVPANRKALTANLAMNQVNLETAKLNLEYTTIRVPFNCRITEIKVEKSQFVQKGQVLAGADGTDVAEIEAQLSIDKMINLLKSIGKTTSFARLDFKTLQDIFQLTARVRLKIGDLEAEWDARFVRADATIDPQTRTVGIIVAVDNPYDKIQIGVRPPLVRNMFCEVELKGRPLPRKIIIPRSALHEGQVYTADPDNRLVRNKVVIDFAQTDFYAVKDGLSEGQWLIVSDLAPAIDGMLLKPVEDKALSQHLILQASGTETIK